MKVYSRFTDYEEYEVFFSLEDLWKAFSESRGLIEGWESYFIGTSHDELEGKADIRYNGPIFNFKTLSDDEIKEIEKEVDKHIEATEKFLSGLKPGQTITGFFGPTRNDRDKYIKQEIGRKSRSIKRFDELDQSLFTFESLNK